MDKVTELTMKLSKINQELRMIRQGMKHKLGELDPIEVQKIFEKIESLETKSKETELQIQQKQQKQQQQSQSKPKSSPTYKLEEPLPKSSKYDREIAKYDKQISQLENIMKYQGSDPTILNRLKELENKRELAKALQNSLQNSVSTQESFAPTPEPEIESTPTYKNPNIWKYGKWGKSIQAMQEKYPTLGDKPITWYQATPNGSCFFIAVDAVINNSKNAHDTLTEGARQLRKQVVDFMESYKDTIDPGVAYEMAFSVGMEPNETGKITPELLSKYQTYMSHDGSWAGQIEINLTAMIIGRPILIFKLNSLEDKGNILWHNGKPSEIFNGDYSQFGRDEPVVLGHVNSSVNASQGNHYIYALFDESPTATYKKTHRKNLEKQSRRSGNLGNQRVSRNFRNS